MLAPPMLWLSVGTTRVGGRKNKYHYQIPLLNLNTFSFCRFQELEDLGFLMNPPVCKSEIYNNIKKCKKKMQLNYLFYLVALFLKRVTDKCRRSLIGEVYKWLKDYPSSRYFQGSKRRFLIIVSFFCAIYWV